MARLLPWALAALLCATACEEKARPGAPTPGGAAEPASSAGPHLPTHRLDPPGYVGRVLARDIVDVASSGQGRLKAVYVRLGDYIEASAPIAELDDKILRKELAVAKATMRAAKAQRDQAVAERDEARQRLSRRRALTGQLSKEEIADAEFSEKKALAALAHAEAQVAEQKAHVDQLEQTLKDTVIRAPFAGSVAARYEEPGAMVGPGTPLVRLISSHQLIVKFAVPADDAGLLAADGKVQATIVALDVAVPGQIKQVAPEIDPASRMVFVEASLDIPEEWNGRIQSGLDARVSLIDPAEKPASPESKP